MPESKHSRDDRRMSGIRELLRPLAQPVTYLGVAMLALIYGALIYLINYERTVAYHEAQRHGGDLARLFDISYSHVFKSLDSVLLSLRKSHQQNPSGFKLADWIQDPPVGNERLFDFTIIGVDGRVVDSTFAKIAVGVDGSNLEGFRAHADSTADQLFIGKPFHMNLTGRWVMALSRRLAAADGSFAGVIGAFIDPAELAKHIGDVNLGPRGSFALLGLDGVTRTRVVDGKIDWQAIGFQFPPRSRIMDHAGRAESGHFWNVPGLIDNESRLVSYRKVAGFPLIVLISISEAEVYRLANDDTLTYWIIALLLTAGVLVAIVMGAKRERKLIEAKSEMTLAKDALARTNEDLEARVTERTAELAQEARRREDAQTKLARVNQDLEARVAERTAALALEMRRREQTQMTLIQAQKMEAVGQLTAGIAHDFNNLLAVIRGSLGFIEGAAARGVATEPELIEAALRATRRGRDLVQRLLAFSRQTPLRAEPTTVDQMVLDTLRLLQRTLGAEIDIVTRLDAQGAAVLVDCSQLANVLLNLALNARDAMPHGGQLTIATACGSSRSTGAKGSTRSPTGEDVCITITDTGVGMTDAVRSRAFEPFFTTKQEGLGSGLGLSMVHGFVQQSGGLIEIDSAVGRGTTISIRLPRIEAASRVDESDAIAGQSTQGKSKTVLLVEDDPDVRIVMAAQLRQLGYVVHAVTNGNEAIDLIESPADIDITLTDIVLPGGLDGVALVKEAMRARPKMGVLCMSGYNPTQEHRKWLMVQNIAFLEKPFSNARLAQALESVLPG